MSASTIIVAFNAQLLRRLRFGRDEALDEESAWARQTVSQTGDPRGSPARAARKRLTGPLIG